MFGKIFREAKSTGGIGKRYLGPASQLCQLPGSQSVSVELSS